MIMKNIYHNSKMFPSLIPVILNTTKTGAIIGVTPIPIFVMILMPSARITIPAR